MKTGKHKLQTNNSILQIKNTQKPQILIKKMRVSTKPINKRKCVKYELTSLSKEACRWIHIVKLYMILIIKINKYKLGKIN